MCVCACERHWHSMGTCTFFPLFPPTSPPPPSASPLIRRDKEEQEGTRKRRNEVNTQQSIRHAHTEALLTCVCTLERRTKVMNYKGMTRGREKKSINKTTLEMAKKLWWKKHKFRGRGREKACAYEHRHTHTHACIHTRQRESEGEAKEETERNHNFESPETERARNADDMPWVHACMCIYVFAA